MEHLKLCLRYNYEQEMFLCAAICMALNVTCAAESSARAAARLQVHLLKQALGWSKWHCQHPHLSSSHAPASLLPHSASASLCPVYRTLEINTLGEKNPSEAEEEKGYPPGNMKGNWSLGFIKNALIARQEESHLKCL